MDIINSYLTMFLLTGGLALFIWLAWLVKKKNKKE
jgi:hypothetical protein